MEVISSQTVAICLFVFNRPEHTLKTVEALKSNIGATDYDLFVFCDGARNEREIERVNEVRNIANKITGFKSIKVQCADTNKGLASSVISGVTAILENFDSVIVFEDDIVSSITTLSFLKHSLDYYSNDKSVFSVSAYNYPKTTVDVPEEYSVYSNYFNCRPCSWAWATWRDRWSSVIWEGDIYKEYLQDRELQKKFKDRVGADIDRMLKKQISGKIDSWAVRFVFNCFKQDKLASYATKSFVSNIGSDGSGTHKGLNNDLVSHETLCNDDDFLLIEKPYFNKTVFQGFNKFVKKRYYFRRFVNIVNRFVDAEYNKKTR
ncbi:TPA: hypothetical protein O4G62_003533 [Vibrio alginolyticus]|nr:hypothetical protein [Vibrio alginolyticus]